jgi:hypothetical protein
MLATSSQGMGKLMTMKDLLGCLRRFGGPHPMGQKASRVKGGLGCAS